MAKLSDICAIPVPVPIAAGDVYGYTFPANSLTTDFFADGDLYWRLADPPTDPLAIGEFWVPGMILRRWRDRNTSNRVLYFANKYASRAVNLWIITEKGIDA